MQHNVPLANPPINPFANYGAIVFGNDFVGRDEIIKTINDRVVYANEPGCISIVGLPKVGKSSLVWHTLIHAKETLRSQHKLPIWVNMVIFRTPEDFFRGLISTTLEELEDLNLLDEKTSKLAHDALVQ